MLRPMAETPSSRFAVLIALGLGAVVILAVAIGGQSIGFAWAENDYLDHMDRIRAWLAGTVGAREVWEADRYYNAHPPLYKYLGLAARALLPFLPFPVAERLPMAVLF